MAGGGAGGVWPRVSYGGGDVQWRGEDDGGGGVRGGLVLHEASSGEVGGDVVELQSVEESDVAGVEVAVAGVLFGAVWVGAVADRDAAGWGGCGVFFA